MACYYPLTAFQTKTGQILFSPSPFAISQFQLPCGRCIGCRITKSKEWAVRCMHEAQMHPENTYLTLTYNDDHLPYNRSLDYTHFQKFIRALRQATGQKIRFYMCGEYGGKTMRAHYHCILFGYKFPDEKLFDNFRGNNRYTSEKLTKLWKYGFHSIGEVTFQSAAYVARYIMKKQSGDRAKSHYQIILEDTGEVFDRQPEFTKMSLKPGIGYSFYQKFKSDIFPLDQIILSNPGGKPKTHPCPGYYRNILLTEEPELAETLRLKRVEKAETSPDTTTKRLKVRENIQQKKIKQLQRNYENDN